MLNAVFLTAHVKHVGHIFCGGAISVARWKRELDAVIGENGVDFVGNCFDQGFQEG